MPWQNTEYACPPPALLLHVYLQIDQVAAPPSALDLHHFWWLTMRKEMVLKPSNLTKYLLIQIRPLLGSAYSPLLEQQRKG